jgi:hypothetical protein
VRAALGWIVLIVLLSGAGLLAGKPDGGGFVLSALTFGAGLLAGAVLLVAIRLARRG